MHLVTRNGEYEMCISPVTMHLKDGRTVAVACHECRQCQGQAVLDWVGRNIAESKTATASHCVTLTYGGGEHPAAKVLTYSDVQKWLKLLRRHGYRFGYFCVGEYGTLKGRTHWHVVIHWKGKVPAWAGVQQGTGQWSDSHMSRGEHKVRFMHQRLDKYGKPAKVKGEPAYWWPHGWTEVSECTVDGIKYAMKYIQKDLGEQSYPMPSKKPLLGADYFMRKAESYVEAGLVPQGGIGYLEGRLMPGMGGYAYSWSDVTYENAEGRRVPLQFMLRGAALELFLTHYVRVWEAARPGQPIPASKLVQEWLCPGTWKDVAASAAPVVPLTRFEREQLRAMVAKMEAGPDEDALLAWKRDVFRRQHELWMKSAEWRIEDGKVIEAGSERPAYWNDEQYEVGQQAVRQQERFRERRREDDAKFSEP
jgi:hypothetical protein